MEKINIFIKSIVALIFGKIAALLGGFDRTLATMVGFMVVDYILGVYAARVNDNVNSKVGFLGIGKKIIMLVPIGIAFSLDNLMSTDILRNTAVMFYIANEGISIIENLGKAGVPIPETITKVLTQLQDENKE